MVAVDGALDVRACRRPNPGVRQNLAATPASLTEKELPKLRHVARAQLEVAPTVVVTARVRRPPNVMNTERFKKRLARECQGVCPRSLCQNDGQHMWITAAVGPACSRLGHHRQVEHELEPVGTTSHLEEPRLLRLEAAVPAGLHGEKVLESELSLPVIEYRNGVVGKTRQHGLFHIP